MARKVSVLLTDDLETGEVPADETVTFALDGHTYEIDLSEKNAKGMRDAMGRYVGAARRASSQTTRRASAGGRGNADRERTQAIRAWAEAAGLMPEGRKGRIPNEIVAQYENRGMGTQTAMSTPTRRSEADLLTDADHPENVAARVTAAKEAAKVQRNTSEPKKANATTKTADKEKAHA